MIQGERQTYKAGTYGEFTIVRNGLCEGIYCSKLVMPEGVVDIGARMSELFVLYENHSEERLTDGTLLAIGQRIISAIHGAHAHGQNYKAREIRTALGIK